MTVKWSAEVMYVPKIMNLKPVVILLLFLQFCDVSNLEEGSTCELNDGSEGICVALSDCYQAKEDLKNLVFPKFCSYNLWNPTVCCFNCHLIQDRFYDSLSVKVIFQFQVEVLMSDSKTNHGLSGYKSKGRGCLEEFHFPCNKYEEYKELDNSVICYESPHDTGDKVVGKDDEARNEYRHLALIGYGENPHHADWMCAGSVISDNYILTAAHCTSSPQLAEIKFAALGIVKLTDHRSTWQIYDVVKIISHPDYQPPSRYHDIALLKTGAKIQYNHEVIPACLHREQDMAEVAIATGWGAMGHQEPWAEILQGVEINKFFDEECMEAYPRHRHLINGYNSTTQVCYGDDEQVNDSCEGDSGGFLQIRTNRKKSKCLYTIIGVTSYGRACGHFGSSGMYTRVAHYMPWIESIAGNLS